MSKYRIGDFVIVNRSSSSEPKYRVGKIVGKIENFLYGYSVQTKHDESSYAENRARLSTDMPQDYILCSVADLSFPDDSIRKKLLREIDCINCILEDE